MDLRNKNVLITSGGTREYIDDVRVVTNISTGALGAKIAEEFYRVGARVHYVHAKQAVMPKPEEGVSESARLTTYQVVTVQDLMDTMKALILAFRMDIVIHSAAVSDFTFRRDIPVPVKLSSDNEEGFIEYLRQTITRTPKIIKKIKEWRKDLYLVGFKFTVGHTEEELVNIAKESGVSSMCDMVIANDKELMKKAREHTAYLIPLRPPKKPTVVCKGKNEVAHKLVEHFGSIPNEIPELFT